MGIHNRTHKHIILRGLPHYVRTNSLHRTPRKRKRLRRVFVEMYALHIPPASNNPKIRTWVSIFVEMFALHTVAKYKLFENKLWGGVVAPVSFFFLRAFFFFLQKEGRKMRKPKHKEQFNTIYKIYSNKKSIIKIKTYA